MNDILIGRNDTSSAELDPHFGNQKAVKAAAETFAANPKLAVAKAIGALGVGEALASTLRDKGAPTPVERVLITAPTCRLGPITDEERSVVRLRSPVGPNGETQRALGVVQECREIEPAFAPDDADNAAALAELAARSGMHDLAGHLARAFVQRWPGHVATARIGRLIAHPSSPA